METTLWSTPPVKHPDTNTKHKHCIKIKIKINASGHPQKQSFYISKKCRLMIKMYTKMCFTISGKHPVIKTIKTQKHCPATLPMVSSEKNACLTSWVSIQLVDTNISYMNMKSSVKNWCEFAGVSNQGFLICISYTVYASTSSVET